MNFVKSINKKKLLAILAAPILILMSLLLIACDTWNITAYDIKYHINRIIYTDDVAKYTLGKEVAPFEDANLNLMLDNANNIMAVYQNKKEKIIDLVIDSTTTPYTYNTNIRVTGMVESDHLPYTDGWAVSDYYGIGFDNSRIFSGILGDYLLDGKGIGKCDDGVCTCGAQMSGDLYYCNCQFDSAPENIILNEIVDVPTVPGDVCQVCWKYELVTDPNSSDGTYTYSATNVCTHGAMGDYFQPTRLISLHESVFTNDVLYLFMSAADPVKRADYYFQPLTFDELVIDGFDFSGYYDKITTYDFDRLYGKFIGDKYKPNDFSHMFSDLPVKKITILNATGLAGKVDDMSGMFENCTNLTTVEFGNLFEGVQPTNISNMFRNCPKLQSVDLSSLDTSKVTDMSNMFTNFDNRDEHLQYFINNVIVPILQPELAVNRPYTEQSFLQAVGYENLSNYLYGYKMEASSNMNGYLTCTVPLTYNEYCHDKTNMTMDEALSTVNTNPNAFKDLNLETEWNDLFSAKPTGESITMEELQYFISYVAAKKDGIITLVTEQQLHDMYEVTKFDGVPATVIHNDVYGFADRNEYLESIINDEIIPTHIPELNDGTHYTVDAFVTKLGITPLEGLGELYSLGYFIPLTCDEAYGLAKKAMPDAPECQFDTIEEMGKYYNDKNITSGDFAGLFPPKADSSAYTDLEVGQIMLKYAGTLGSFASIGVTSAAVYTPEEMDALFSAEPAVTFSTLQNPIVLTLGGVDSKFIINADTNVTNMLGNHAKFASITLPTIASGVQVILPQEYVVDNRVVVSNADSGISNKTINYKTADFEPLPPEVPTPTQPADNKDGNNSWSKTNTIIILSVVGFALVAIMVITTLMGIKKSRKEK